ncbi:MAG: hypothetical protein IJY85_07615 [Ruminococcus sp.]|nr:hypothetical protein [Ruminococcus sp.]
MKKLSIYRKRQFRNALMPYWIILGTSKESFLNHLSEVHEFSPDQYGTRIGNGKTITIPLPDHDVTVFAVTIDGIASNELQISASSDRNAIRVTTQGGGIHPCYPVLVFDKEKKSSI